MASKYDTKYCEVSDGDEGFNKLLRESVGAPTVTATFSDMRLAISVKDERSVIIARSAGMAVAYAFDVDETQELKTVAQKLAVIDRNGQFAVINHVGRFAVINNVLVIFPHSECTGELVAPAIHVCAADDDECDCPSFGGLGSRQALDNRGLADYEHCAFLPLNAAAMHVFFTAFLHADDDKDEPAYTQAEEPRGLKRKAPETPQQPGDDAALESTQIAHD
jgi:hypothetical protein